MDVRTALEACLTLIARHSWTSRDQPIIAAARAALAQPQEPVAWLENLTDAQPHAVTDLKYRTSAQAEAGVRYVPVYAAPPADALDAARYRYIRDTPWSPDLERVITLHQNAIWDATIDQARGK